MTLTIRIATLCLTIIAATGSSTTWAVVCPSPGYDLITQAQVDALGASGCDKITQSLVIEGSDITNLDALSGITSVGGDLGIGDSPLLTNLDGLSGITSVGNDLYLFNNIALTNLDALSGITSVVGGLSIYSNPLLTNLDGLSGITGIVGGDLTILVNTTLTNLAGLSGITSVVGGVQIGGDALTNLAGLSGITSVEGRLAINGNPLLTNLDALSGITSVGGDLAIQENSRLADCVGIAQLLGWLYGPPDDSVGGAISVGVPPNASGCNSVEEILASVTVPSQPVITQVSAGNGYAALTFTPSTQTEALFPITGYEAACLGSEVENITSPALTISAGINSPITISGLTNNRDYTCTVAPVTKLGALPTSAAVTATPRPEPPATPSITSVTENGSGLVVSFILASDGGAPITDYTATCGGISASSNSSPIIVEGLTNGQQYSCTVVATNSVGSSSASAAASGTLEEVTMPGLPIWLLYEATKGNNSFVN